MIIITSDIDIKKLFKMNESDVILPNSLCALKNFACYSSRDADKRVLVLCHLLKLPLCRSFHIHG